MDMQGRADKMGNFFLRAVLGSRNPQIPLNNPGAAVVYLPIDRHRNSKQENPSWEKPLNRHYCREPSIY
jgi:hypothetical protein